jgi:hypothetical protein
LDELTWDEMRRLEIGVLCTFPRLEFATPINGIAMDARGKNAHDKPEGPVRGVQNLYVLQLLDSTSSAFILTTQCESYLVILDDLF